MRPRNTFIRISLIATALAILSVVYIFQDLNWLAMMTSPFSLAGRLHPFTYFIFNKAGRLILNDFACLLLIYAFFYEARYLKIAFWLFLVEFLVILPVYFFLKLSFEGDSEISSPLLSQIHRLIVNPTLMLLLMLGFLYQNRFQSRQGKTS